MLCHAEPTAISVQGAIAALVAVLAIVKLVIWNLPLMMREMNRVCCVDCVDIDPCGARRVDTGLRGEHLRVTVGARTGEH